MFTWSTAKSAAESLLSSWVLKRGFKFVLKKNLGKLFIGEIDLDQLQVELTQGTVKLHHLPLNVDYLNSQLGSASPVFIKEGSIGHLLVRMPWKGNGCQVEVDTLEIVLAPCVEETRSTDDNGTCSTTSDNATSINNDSTRYEYGMADNPENSAHDSVHEGVKTIAKMVKLFLTSFNVKIKKLFIKFDPFLDKDESKFGCLSSFVFRISEIECGTCVSEDDSSKTDDFLGISRLTNFAKFHGAVLELLQTNNNIGSQAQHITTQILTGKEGGFSGNLKLSIPWKNGSLDIRKVDADISIDPLELRFQPRTVKWILLTWETYKSLSEDKSSHLQFKPEESVCLNTTSGIFSSDLSSTNLQESETDSMLPGTHLIRDWMPLSVDKDIDLAASVDQFFECFDGMRSSQSALGSSGMWNWTCSVFSAITAASTLASGSLHIPSEHQHVQTNLKATFAGISAVFFFHDDDKPQWSDLNGNLKSTSLGLHYLGAECRDIELVLQVCPQVLRLRGMVKYIEVSDYIRNEDVSLCSDDVNGETLLIQRLQAQVQGTLPTFPSGNNDSYSDELLGNKGPLVKITMCRTSGSTQFKYTGGSNSSAGDSFSVELPPIMCWVNISLIIILLDILNEMGRSVESFNEKNGCSSREFGQKHGSSRRNVGPSITNISGKESSRGIISIPSARVILCFPLNSIKNCRDYCSWERFVVLDFSSPLKTNEAITDSNWQSRYSSMGVRTLNLNVGSLGVYLITSATGAQGPMFSAHKIMSVCNSPGCLSVVSFLWQDGPVSGPWVADRAKALVTLDEATSEVVGKGNEFATVTTVKNLKDLHSQTRQEIILSSANFIHVRLPPVVINLGSSEYAMFHELLTEMISGLSRTAGGETSGEAKASVMQASIFLECESVEVLIRPDNVNESIKSSMQRELPGSWNSLKLNIKKFEMLSVSNIGDIKDATFFWLAHGDGKLWGSVTENPEEDFILISCCNSTMKRGDGGGSNALSSRLAGSDIIHLQLPKGGCSYFSISVRCSTIIAVGGRLDWAETISSFFSLPSREIKQEDGRMEEEKIASRESCFVLSLVDVGLGYEPYLRNKIVQNTVIGRDSCPTNVNEETNEPYVACLLAASSLNLSNKTSADSMDNDYNIRLQDLGLLLSQVSDTEPRKLDGAYSVDHLRKMGYVKIAREALIEIILRTNCGNGHSWDVECSKSQILVETCHDTTAALIRLAGQLQQLVAPDVEESLVHLQTRWDNFQQAQVKTEISDESRNFDLHPLSLASNVESGGTGLMNEICDDAFSLDGSQTHLSSESSIHDSLDGSFLDEAYCVSIENSDNSRATLFQPEGCIPEIIEDYCLSELRPLSELSVGPHEIRRCRSWNAGDGAWYTDTSLRIVENHVSEKTQQVSMKGYTDWSSPSDTRFNNCKEVMGRVLLKNMNLHWRMIGGSDWYKTKTNNEHSTHKYGRDTTICLELVLSGMQFQCDIFPAGEICVSKLSLFIQDFYLYDKSSAAPWKLVLGYYNSKTRPRESTSKALKLDIESVRPDPQTPLEEYRLRIAFLPILLHLHQTQLEFLIDFFGSNSTLDNQSSDNPQNSDGPKLSSTNNDKLIGHDIAAEALLPYFQKFEIWPILIRVDYIPQRVDLAALRGGKYVELVNLFPWKGIELELKDVHGVGVYGWGNVCETVMGEWLEDISQNQIHRVLQGLPTIRSLVAVGAGAAKLVTMPVDNYRTDHRVLRGMQRGTFAFLRSISLEAIGLGLHLAAGANDFLLQAECVLTSSPYSVARPVQSKPKTNVRCNQPKGAKQGIQQAYESLSGGLGKSASALVRTPLNTYHRGASAGSALATAVRGVPAAAIAPASACASALHYTLLGLRNSLDPEHKKESMEKYLGPTHPFKD
ncbi:hypothetical protein ACFE04_024342 [Oxalis oulophora]